jgi:hypothetical protein
MRCERYSLNFYVKLLKENFVDIISIIGLVVGIVSFAASVVFFVLGLRSEHRNQQLLNSINDAIQRWQTKIMESSIELLNSRPEIVAKNTLLQDSKSKSTFLEQLSERIRYIIEHPVAGEEGFMQFYALNQLLQAFFTATKSSLPPEILAQMAMDQQRHMGNV